MTSGRDLIDGTRRSHRPGPGQLPAIVPVVMSSAYTWPARSPKKARPSPTAGCIHTQSSVGRSATLAPVAASRGGFGGRATERRGDRWAANRGQGRHVGFERGLPAVAEVARSMATTSLSWWPHRGWWRRPQGLPRFLRRGVCRWRAIRLRSCRRRRRGGGGGHQRCRRQDDRLGSA